jgi:hypothetical protein
MSARMKNSCGILYEAESDEAELGWRRNEDVGVSCLFVRLSHMCSNSIRFHFVLCFNY